MMTSTTLLRNVMPVTSWLVYRIVSHRAVLADCRDGFTRPVNMGGNLDGEVAAETARGVDLDKGNMD
ncbi:hypothetical protein LA080_006847 [Diaporthe eres]|nr:hypothetical protein LA080_006847 [Diaporthe eres]